MLWVTNRIYLFVYLYLPSWSDKWIQYCNSKPWFKDWLVGGKNYPQWHCVTSLIPWCFQWGDNKPLNENNIDMAWALFDPLKIHLKCGGVSWFFSSSASPKDTLTSKHTGISSCYTPKWEEEHTGPFHMQILLGSKLSLARSHHWFLIEQIFKTTICYTFLAQRNWKDTPFSRQEIKGKLSFTVVILPLWKNISSHGQLIK